MNARYLNQWPLLLCITQIKALMKEGASSHDFFNSASHQRARAVVLPYQWLKFEMIQQSNKQRRSSQYIYLYT